VTKDYSLESQGDSIPHLACREGVLTAYCDRPARLVLHRAGGESRVLELPAAPGGVAVPLE